MALLDRVITRTDVVSRGALQVMSEDALRRISHNADSMTVGEILRLQVNPRLLTCAVMHEDVVSTSVMRKAACAVALDVLERLAGKGTYIDFRTRRAVDAALAFASGERSMGEMGAACLKAETARDDVTELGDAAVTQGASIAIDTCDPDARSAVMRTIADAVEVFGEDDDQRRYAGILERTLREGRS
ncbi:MAG TPA: hypothetical protein VFH72_04980 [Candidatus Baltobacteraceae bacterium]|nr:hypothetical protein [Candidatus Baltobacteraceae bacterium]